MESRIGLCLDCLSNGAYDCPMYICEDEEGFVIACCIVYAVKNSLTILGTIDSLRDRYEED